ncbi:GTP-binding protein [Saccharopolyspora sp. NPDC000995]
MRPAWLDEQKHFHNPAVASVGVELEDYFDESALRAWLSDLTAEHGDDLYQFKDVVAVRGDARHHVLQGIHRIFEPPGEPAAPPRVLRLVWRGQPRSRVWTSRSPAGV